MQRLVPEHSARGPSWHGAPSLMLNSRMFKDKGPGPGGIPKDVREGTMPLTKLINENHASLAGWPEIGSHYGTPGLAGLCLRATLENA